MSENLKQSYEDARPAATVDEAQANTLVKSILGEHSSCEPLIDKMVSLFSDPLFENELKQLDMIVRGNARDNYNVVVVGEFNRGKTTFVNALSGNDLLPTGNVPTTAILTKIINSPNLRIRHIVKGAAMGEISNPETIKNIKADKDGKDPDGMLLVEAPLEWVGNSNIAIFDTPGVSDTVSKRADHVRRAMLLADCTVFAMSADMACSMTEMAFLKEQILLKKMCNVIILITKLDHVDECERSQVVAYIEQKIHKVLPTAKICAYRGMDGCKIQGLWASDIEGIRKGIVELTATDRVLKDRNLRLSQELLLLLESAKVRIRVLEQAEKLEDRKREEATRLLECKRNSLGIDIQRLCVQLESLKNKAKQTVETDYRKFEESAIDDMTMSLRRSVNPKEWLEVDLPHLAKKTFNAFITHEHAKITTLVGHDKNTVFLMLKRMFSLSSLDCPVAIIDCQNNVPSGMIANSLGKGISVSDSERSRTFFRWAAIASVPLAIILTGGVAGITMVAGGCVGLGGELMLRKKIKEQREVLLDSISDRFRSAIQGMERDSMEAVEKSYSLLASQLEEKAKKSVELMLRTLSATKCTQRKIPSRSADIGEIVHKLIQEVADVQNSLSA